MRKEKRKDGCFCGQDRLDDQTGRPSMSTSKGRGWSPRDLVLPMSAVLLEYKQQPSMTTPSHWINCMVEAQSCSKGGEDRKRLFALAQEGIPPKLCGDTKAMLAKDVEAGCSNVEDRAFNDCDLTTIPSLEPPLSIIVTFSWMKRLCATLYELYSSKYTRLSKAR